MNGLAHGSINMAIPPSRSVHLAPFQACLFDRVRPYIVVAVGGTCRGKNGMKHLAHLLIRLDFFCSVFKLFCVFTSVDVAKNRIRLVLLLLYLCIHLFCM